MATIINNPSGNTAEDSSAGIVIGIVVALILVVLFAVFVWPTLGTNPAAPATGGNTTPGASTNVNVTLPAGDSTYTPPATTK